MQINELPIENRFGQAVMDGRVAHRMSQKTLAVALREHGLSLDASAISRIEKGTRAIRLNEAAIIAALLGFSLAEVESPRDPKADFHDAERALGVGLHNLFSAAMKVASNISSMERLLDMQPELLVSLDADFPGGPTNIHEFLRLSRKMKSIRLSIAPSIAVSFETIELRDAVKSLICDEALQAVSEVIGVEYSEAF